MPTHSYEEIRAAAMEILSGREKSPYMNDVQMNTGTLMDAIADVFRRRETPQPSQPGVQPQRPELLASDRDTFREVFWDLLSDRIVFPGCDNSNPDLPFFSISTRGKKILTQENPYFFHDVSSYEKIIRDNVPAIDSATLIYLQEAMQCFRAGCMLASTVMVGVAAEHTFSLLLDAAASSPAYGMLFQKAVKERTVLQQFTECDKVLDSHFLQKKVFDRKIAEGLENEFVGIQQIIRNFRNDAGHPTGAIMTREQTFVLLQVFVQYAKKAYQIIAFFKGN